MFRTVPLSIIRSFSLYTQQWYMSYRFADRLRAGSGRKFRPDPARKLWSHIPLLCVQWKTPDDGQRNCPKHVEFYSKNKFEKLVHLVGFVMGTVSFPRRTAFHGLSWLVSLLWSFPCLTLLNTPGLEELHRNKSVSVEPLASCSMLKEDSIMTLSESAVSQIWWVYTFVLIALCAFQYKLSKFRRQWTSDPSYFEHTMSILDEQARLCSVSVGCNPYFAWRSDPTVLHVNYQYVTQTMDTINPE